MAELQGEMVRLFVTVGLLAATKNEDLLRVRRSRLLGHCEELTLRHRLLIRVVFLVSVSGKYHFLVTILFIWLSS